MNRRAFFRLTYHDQIEDIVNSRSDSCRWRLLAPVPPGGRSAESDPVHVKEEGCPAPVAGIPPTLKAVDYPAAVNASDLNAWMRKSSMMDS